MVSVKVAGVRRSDRTAQRRRRMPPIMPPPCRRCHMPPVEECSRRLVSARRHRHRRISSSAASSITDQLRVRLAGELAHRPEGHRDSAPFFGFGVGYSLERLVALRRHRRISRQGELPGARQLHRILPGGRCFDNYDGNQSDWRVHGQRLCRSRHLVVPHAVHRRRRRRRLHHDHAASRRRLHHRSGTTGFGYAVDDQSKWNFAWALHAGLAYKVTPTISRSSFAYRYLNLGNAQTGDHRLRLRRLRHQRSARRTTPSTTSLARLQARRALDAAAEPAADRSR